MTIQEQLGYYGVLLAVLSRDGSETLRDFFWKRTFNPWVSYKKFNQANEVFQNYIRRNRISERLFWTSEETELFSQYLDNLKIENLEFTTISKLIQYYVGTSEGRIDPKWWSKLPEETDTKQSSNIIHLMILQQELSQLPTTKMKKDVFDEKWYLMTQNLIHLKLFNYKIQEEKYNIIYKRCLSLKTNEEYFQLIQDFHNLDDQYLLNPDIHQFQDEVDAGIAMHIINMRNFYSEDQYNHDLPKLGDLVAVRKLGSGGFGHVWLFMDKENETKVAVKQSLRQSKDTLDILKHEIEIMRRLKHQNIVKYYGARIMQCRLSLVMEYLSNGSVSDIIRNHGALTEKTTLRLTKEILQGTVYLHSQLIIHRDIKGGNVLLTDNYSAKLTDFGLSWKMSDNGCEAKGKTGTICYMAPEVAKGIPYGPKADIWSIGCTILEMMTTMPPWSRQVGTTDDILYMIANFPPIYSLSSNVSTTTKTFLKSIFTLKPDLRPSAKMLLEDPAMS